MSNIGVAYKRVNDLTELSTIPADGDFFIVVDISDANREKKILASRVISNTGINLADTTTSTTGVITKASTRFIHNFHHPTGNSAIPDGLNTFVGVNAGNFTMGSTATETDHGSYNIGLGGETLLDNTIGRYNIAVGYQTLFENTIGEQNVAVGSFALWLNVIGKRNTAIGDNVLGSAIGDENTAVGRWSMLNTTSGKQNSAFGTQSLINILSTDLNVGMGYRAGMFIAGGAVANTISNTSIYIGANTKALADGGDNEIVIGDSVTGLGSNTVVIGNDSITKTILRGDVTVTALNLVSYENETVYFEGNAVFN